MRINFNWFNRLKKKIVNFFSRGRSSGQQSSGGSGNYSGNDLQKIYRSFREMCLKNDCIEAWNSAAFDLASVESPFDIQKYCPRYKNFNAGNRLLFWRYFLAVVSYFESNHNPKLTYKEPFNDNNGERVISSGLFQISVESVNGYLKRSEWIKQKDLFNPAENIRLATIIMAKWLSNDGYISKYIGGNKWRGPARYWSVLRNQKREKIQNLLLQKFN